MRRFVTVVAVTLAALATPAHAEKLSQSIPITQTDRQDPVAAAALYTRVTEVAKSLCAKLNRPLYGFPQASPADVAECEREAVERAIGASSMPFLAQIHAEKVASLRLSTATTTIAAR